MEAFERSNLENSSNLFHPNKPLLFLKTFELELNKTTSCLSYFILTGNTYLFGNKFRLRYCTVVLSYIRLLQGDGDSVLVSPQLALHIY